MTAGEPKLSMALRFSEATVELGGNVVLDAVSFDVAKGSWVALIGPNGAGKTTAIRAALGLTPLSHGSVELAGRPTATLTSRQRALLAAYVPQDPLIPAGSTVTDYALLGRNPHIGFFAVESAHDISVVRDVLERLELSGFADRQVGTLSGGEWRRVVLARALAQRAAVVFLDEPTAELDLGHAQEVLDLVDELRHSEGLTVISAVHDLTLASQYADSLVLLDAGRVVAQGDATAVLTPALIERHYRARVVVIPAPEGSRGLVVSPVRAAAH